MPRPARLALFCLVPPLLLTVLIPIYIVTLKPFDIFADRVTIPPSGTLEHDFESGKPMLLMIEAAFAPPPARAGVDVTLDVDDSSVAITEHNHVTTQYGSRSGVSMYKLSPSKDCTATITAVYTGQDSTASLVLQPDLTVAAFTKFGLLIPILMAVIVAWVAGLLIATLRIFMKPKPAWQPPPIPE